jgi:hypothetical protein
MRSASGLFWVGLSACCLLGTARGQITGSVPFAATQPPTGITTTGATFNGMATPNGAPTMAWFEWGTNTNYGLFTSQSDTSSGTAVVRVSLGVTSLLPAQVYHFRLVVSNALSVVYGADQPFSTGQRALAWGDDYYSQLDSPGITNAVAVAGGTYHSLALRNDGTVAAWGDNAQATCSGQATVPGGLNNVEAVAAGSCYSLALRSDGSVLAWGGGNAINVPPGLTGLIAIAGGGDHCLALRPDGTVLAWGDNTFGQTNVPPGLSNAVAIAAGGTHSLALRNDGIVIAWGNNSAGQTTPPANLGIVTSIAAGGSHCLALNDAGQVFAWGDNSLGQTNVPSGLSNVVALAAGATFSVALASDGSIAAWGQYETYDSFGFQSFNPMSAPPRIRGAAALGAGANHALAIGLDNDYFDSRLPIFGTNITLLTSNVGATSEPGEPIYLGTIAPTSSIWFTWTAPSAGGVVVSVPPDFDSPLDSPIIAVYTGTSLGSLSNVAFNTSPFNGRGGPLGARGVFTAAAGQAYQIVVDGSISTQDPSGLTQGPLTFTLDLSAPPSNDLFSNATLISDTLYETSGSFIGASHEPDEPSHGDSTLEQTLWWAWTAPTNLGPTTFPLRLTADGVSFPPGIGVYTGNSLATLVDQISSLQTNVPGPNVVYTNGMTSIATFTANSGATYYIALAGLENDPDSTIPIFGNYRFRLNTQALALSVPTLTTSSNDDGSVSYTANALLQNLGSAPSNPLRVYVSAITGGSLRGSGGVIETTQLFEGIYPALPVVLGPGQTNLVMNIQGIIPAPSQINGGEQTALGWGLYAQLQEQPLGSTNWFTVDEDLVSFGNWPSFAGVEGPGGGVIRLDPDYISSSSFSVFKSVQIDGPTNISENTSVQFAGRAFYSSTNFLFTNSLWTSSLFTITNGLLNVGQVSSNTLVTVWVAYAYGGYFYTNSLAVRILLEPPEITTQPASQTKQAGDQVSFTVAASGSPPLIYQWRFYGTNLTDNSRITGSQTSSLTLSNLVVSDSGAYVVNVSNGAGVTNSLPATLTVTSIPVLLTGSRTYDGTSDVAGAILTVVNLLNSDSVALSGSGVLASKNAGVEPITSFGNLALEGLSKDNYTLVGASGLVTINKRLLSVTAVATNKLYDGTATAAVSFSDNRVSGDALTLSYTTADFADSNAGIQKQVTVNGITITGPDSTNYFLTNTTLTTVADILAPEFLISGPELQGQTFSVSVLTIPGLTYVLEYKDHVADPSWSTADQQIGDGTPKRFQDPSAPITMRFYRIRAHY